MRPSPNSACSSASSASMGARTLASYTALFPVQYDFELSASRPSKNSTASTGQPRKRSVGDMGESYRRAGGRAGAAESSDHDDGAPDAAAPPGALHPGRHYPGVDGAGPRAPLAAVAPGPPGRGGPPPARLGADARSPPARLRARRLAADVPEGQIARARRPPG